MLHHSSFVLAQVPTLAPGQLENWLIPAIAVLSIVALVKKVLPLPKPGHKDLVTRKELHESLTSVRDTVDSRFLTLCEKIDHLSNSVNEKFTELKSTVSRIDERTKQ